VGLDRVMAFAPCHWPIAEGVQSRQQREQQGGEECEGGFHVSRNHFTFQTFTSSIHTVLGVRKLNQRFIGWAKPSER